MKNRVESEVREYLALPPAFRTKWKRALSAYARAIRDMEEGADNTEATMAFAKARDRLDDFIYEAGAYSREAAAKLQEECTARRATLGSIDAARTKGLEARRQARNEEIKKLDAEIREARRPYEWMRK